MKNAVISIIVSIAKEKNRKVPWLEKYANNREEILSLFESREKGKKSIISLVFGGGQEFLDNIKNVELLELCFGIKTECEMVRCEIFNFRHGMTEKEKRSAFAKELFKVEAKILKQALGILEDRDMTVSVRIFDGLQIPIVKGQKGNTLLRELITQFSNIKEGVEFVRKKIVPNPDVLSLVLKAGVNMDRKIPKPPKLKDLLKKLPPSIGFRPQSPPTTSPTLKVEEEYHHPGEDELFIKF